MEYNIKWNGRTIDNTGRHHLRWSAKRTRARRCLSCPGGCLEFRFSNCLLVLPPLKFLCFIWHSLKARNDDSIFDGFVLFQFKNIFSFNIFVILDLHNRLHRIVIKLYINIYIFFLICRLRTCLLFLRYY